MHLEPGDKTCFVVRNEISEGKKQPLWRICLGTLFQDSSLTQRASMADRNEMSRVGSRLNASCEQALLWPRCMRVIFRRVKWKNTMVFREI